jgi:hypothetical protein
MARADGTSVNPTRLRTNRPPSQKGWITLEGPGPGESERVWLLACSSPLQCSELDLRDGERLPPSEDEAAQKLAERLLTLHATEGFMLFDVGLLERE